MPPFKIPANTFDPLTAKQLMLPAAGQLVLVQVANVVPEKRRMVKRNAEKIDADFKLPFLDNLLFLNKPSFSILAINSINASISVKMLLLLVPIILFFMRMPPFGKVAIVGEFQRRWSTPAELSTTEKCVS